MIANVQSIFDHSVDDNYAPYDDFDAGRAGLLYASSFLNTFYQRDDVISRSSIVAIGEAIIRRGEAVSSHPTEYLEWYNPNDEGKWLGQSHGSAGVLSQLLDVPELLEDGSHSREMILKTLDHIVANQFPSGNFPSQYYAPEDDVLIQWDHGAPGVLGALVKAANLFSSKEYLESAMRAADCTWERGLLYKGLELCHGISGNTYMQIYMYSMTQNATYLYRALQFQEFVASTPDLSDVNLMRYPTPNPYGWYVGSFEGALMLWVDLLDAAHGSGVDNFSRLSVPGYEPLL